MSSGQVVKYKMFDADDTLTKVLMRAYKLTEAQISKVESDSGVSITDIFNDNKESIKSGYTGEDKDKEASQDNIPLNTAIKVNGDFNKAANSFYVTNVRQQFDIKGTNNYKAFMGQAIQELIGQEKYIPSVKSFDGTYKREEQVFKVYVFSKTLGKVTDITNYVSMITTNVAGTGGNFSIKAAALRAFWDAENDTWKEYNDETNFYHRRPTSVLSGNTRSVIDKETTRKGVPLYFDKILTPNDIVFISYEKLDIEVVTSIFGDTRDVEHLGDLEGSYFDMIGLVDRVSIDKTHRSGSASITITGRDLSKVILEDGVYFFPVTQGSTGFLSNFFANIPNEEVDREEYSRIFGVVSDLTLFTNQRLDTLVQYIYNKFTNIKILDDQYFRGVGDGDKGIMNYINLIIDEEVGQRQIVDDSIATDSGSTFNFISKIIQQPFIEFFQDTYRDRFNWIIRKPPFTRTSYLEQFKMVRGGEGLVIEPEEMIQSDLNWSDETTYSWFRVQPMGYFLGDTYAANFALPAVYFPELAKLFGNKALDVTSNYLDYGNNGQELIGNVDVGFYNGLQDLRYLVETNVYLPFTKTGQIIIYGNRTIKKGMIIMVRAFNMYFYVDSVSQQAVVSNNSTIRKTTLQVSRGMTVKDFDAYFDLVDYGSDPKLGDRKVNWKINTSVLDYLIRKKNSSEELYIVTPNSGSNVEDTDTEPDTSNLA